MGKIKRYCLSIVASRLQDVIDYGLPAGTEVYDRDIPPYTIWADHDGTPYVERDVVCLKADLDDSAVIVEGNVIKLHQRVFDFVPFAPRGVQYNPVRSHARDNLNCAIWRSLRDHGITHFEIVVEQHIPHENSFSICSVSLMAGNVKHAIAIHYGDQRDFLLNSYLAEAQQIVAKIPFLTVSAKEE